MAEQKESQETWKSKLRRKTVKVGGSIALAGAAVVVGLGVREIKNNGQKDLKHPGPSVERFVNPTPINPELGEASSINPYETNIYNDINEIRKAAGLTELQMDDSLTRLSQLRSKDMAENSYFSHSDEDGKPYYVTMITATCDNPEIGGYGENLEYNNYPDPSADAIEAWMRSQEHKDNMLNPRWQSIGVGEAKDTEGRFFFTTLFSDRPCEAPVQFIDSATNP